MPSYQRKDASVRRSSGLMAGLAVLAVAGCSGAGPSAVQASVPGAVGASAPGGASSGSSARSAPGPNSNRPVQGATAAGVRAATARFEELYFAGQFTSSWALLTSAAKREVPESVWVGVHEGCSSGSAGVTRTIKSVTLFGNAAIVTEAVSGVRRATDEYVFNFSGGGWLYSPADLSIYRHSSVSADISATKAAGLCTGQKVF